MVFLVVDVLVLVRVSQMALKSCMRSSQMLVLPAAAEDVKFKYFFCHCPVSLMCYLCNVAEATLGKHVALQGWLVIT